MCPNLRACAWLCAAALVASASSCGGQVSSTSDDKRTASQPFSGYVTASQSPSRSEILASFSGASAPLMLPFLGSCSQDNMVSAGCCCYAATTPARGAGSVGAGMLKVDPGGGMPVVSILDLQSDYVAMSAVPMWSAGAVLHVTATGGSVQPFVGSLQTVTLVEGIAPPIFDANPLAIDRSQDFSLQWTPGSVASAQVILWFETDPASWIIACSVADAEGHLQVPAAMLQKVTADDRAVLNLDRFSTSVVTAGNASVTLEGVAGSSKTVTFR